MEEKVSQFTELVADGGILGAIIGIIILARHMWKTIGKDLLDETKQTAESNIIKMMSDEVHRVTEEIKSLRGSYTEEIQKIREMHIEEIKKIKKLHDSERGELIRKIENLETLFSEIRDKNETMKKEALSLYQQFVTLDATNKEEINTLRESLLALVFRDPSGPQ